MSTLVFTTPYGATYKVNSDGQIYAGPNDVKPSNGWRAVGFVRVNAWFSAMQPLDELRQIAAMPYTERRAKLRYKNGHPRYTLVDCDHGYRRVWGNTVYHGIENVWLMD